jgi:PAS domain S-box-containing protein
VPSRAAAEFPILVFHRESGAILAANEAAVRAYGGTRKELFGCFLTDLFPPSGSGGPDLKHIHDWTAPWTGSWRLRRKDGTTVWSKIGMIDTGDAAHPATMILVVDTEASSQDN